MSRRETEPQQSTFRTLGVSFAHLGALSAFAVAQPLFDLLGESPDFFAVRGSSRWDIVVFALVVALLPPVVLVAVEALAALVSRQLQRFLHLAFVGGLAGIVAVQVLKRAADLTSTGTVVGLAALLGALAALLYWRLPPARSLLTVLAPAPVFFLAYFLFVSPVAELTLADDPDVALANVRARAPVVMVVFDEFPVSSLLAPNGEIDAVRYPNFAELAAGSTWFRNTSTISYSTTHAVPAMLTGTVRTEGAAPVFASHPRNLFTLLGGDYRMNVVEAYTRLCPKVVCTSPPPAAAAVEEPVSLYSDVGIVYLHLLAPPRLEETLPPITQQWMNFGSQEEDEEVGKLLEQALTEARGKRPRLPKQYHSAHTRMYEQFVASIRPTEQPSLNFVHFLFPHGPWWHFPSGNQSSIGAASPPPGLEGSTGRWKGRFLTLQSYQRHLLQVGFVDRLVGALLDRLRETDMYDDSLVVVAADHGVSFRSGESWRDPTPATLPDIAFVPFFVKQPGQNKGEIVDHHVQVIDVLPTIADALGITMPWGIDGRTAFEDPIRGTVRVTSRSGEAGVTEAPFATAAQQQEAAIARRVALFGVGDWARLFVVDPHRNLHGRQVSTLNVVGSSRDRATIDHELTRRLVARKQDGFPFVPSPLQGHVTGSGARSGRTLAVAVNDRIAALATTHAASGEVRFSALPAESAFQKGRNVVSFFWVDGPVAAPRLTQLRSE